MTTEKIDIIPSRPTDRPTEHDAVSVDWATVGTADYFLLFRGCPSGKKREAKEVTEIELNHTQFGGV